MGKKTAICLGAGLFLIGAFGVFLAINSIGAPAVVKKDLETKGVITDLYADVVEHKLTGIDLSKHYQFDYEFVAENGKTYGKTATISEAEAQGLAVGQKITVQYHSHHPSINAAKGYGVYLPVDSFVEHSPMSRILVCSVFCVLGAILLYSGFTYKEDGDQEQITEGDFFEQPAQQQPTQQPAAANSSEIPDEQMEKLERYRQAYLANQK